MDKVKAVVDKIVHPKDHSSTTHTTGDPTHTGNHTVSHAGTHTGTTGHSAGVTGTSGGAGPHNSSMLNKADPRVDSDLDGSKNFGAAQHGLGGVHNQHNTGLTGTSHSSGLTGAPVTGTHSSATTGPHSSNLANKLDPRVSDTGSHNTGLTGSNHGTVGSSGLTGASHNQHTTGSGLTSGYSTGSTNAGPHNSNMLNSIDPRVDSDRDGSKNLGAAQYGPGAHNQHTTGLTGNTHGSGLTGSNHSSGLTGSTHSSGLTGNNHGTHGPVGGALTGGPAPNTSGPHKSDMMNKLDPRVDSDRDGSKTIGQAPAPQY